MGSHVLRLEKEIRNRWYNDSGAVAQSEMDGMGVIQLRMIMVG